MKIDPVATAVMGIQRGMDDAQRAAVEVASASRVKLESDNPTDVVKHLLELSQAKQQVDAAARAVQTGDQMVGSLLDDMA